MIIIDLLYNLSILIAITVLSGFINIRYKRTKLQSKILQGLLFGITAVIGMMNPFILTEGIIFDGRSIIISLCTLFFGPVSGVIAAAIAIAYRVYIGGGGALMGTLVIIASFLIGLLFYTRREKSFNKELTLLQLYFFGILVHVAMLILVLSLPSKNIFETYKLITLSVLGIYPFVTVIIGKILLDQEEKQNFVYKIRESEKLFRTTLYSIGDAVITTDPQSKIMQMNPVAEQLTGWKEYEARGKSLIDIYKIINEDTFLQITTPLNRILTAGKVVTLANHTMLISKEGKQIPIADSGAPIKDDQNNIIGVVLVFRDQTEERTKQKLLSDSEERYRNFFEKNIAGTYLSNVEGKLLDCNASFAKLLGYNSIVEILNINTAKLYPHSAFRDDFLDKLREKKNLINSEIILTKKDGTEIICIENVVGIFDDNGKLTQFQGYIIDITERKQSELELEKIKTHYQKLIENAPDGIVLITLEGKFKYVSASARKMFGYSNIENIDLNPDELTHPEDLPKVYTTLSELINDPSLVPKIEYRFKHRNGNWIWIESTFTNLLAEPSVEAIVINFREVTESRHAREELKASEELYRTLIETSPDAITVTDRDGCIIFLSKKALELYGHTSASEVIGRSVLEWTSDEYRQKAITSIQSILSGSKQTRDEFLLKRKDESLFWAEVNAAAVYDSDGDVRGSIIIARDISERKQTEKVLQESEEKFRSLFENNPNAIFISDPETLTILYCNTNACKMNGYEYDELIGQSLNILHTNEISEKIIDPEFHKSQIELLKQNQVVTIESTHKRKDGSLFQIESSISLINIGGKTLTMGIDRDITERKLAEVKMRLSEERYKTLFESSPVGIVLEDDKGTILEANKSFCKMMGYSRNELVGKNIKIFASSENYVNVEKNIRELLSGKVLEHNVESFNKDGKPLSMQLSETRIALPDNRPGILSISIDITERKQFERALNESESSYQGLFNSVSEAIYILDENGIFIDVNEGALKMYGFKKEELIGKTPEYVSIEGKNDLPAVAELLGKAFNGENQKLEFWGKRKNGSAFLKDIRLYPGKYFNKPVVIALAQDITERKRIETVQKIQYNLAEAVVSSKNLSVLFEMVRDELSNIINVKNFYIALYDEQTGMLRSDVDEDELEQISEWSAKNSMTGYVIEIQKSLLLTKSEINKMIETGVANMVGIIPEVWLGVPFKVSGKVIGVLVVQSYTNPYEYDNSTRELLDIVAHELSIFIHHKRAEEQTLKLSTAVSQSPATIVITDLKGNIEYVNPKFSALTGYSFEEVKGQNPRILNSGTKRTEDYKEMWETILTGKEWHGEFYNKKKNGELFWESATISPIINQTGEITNFIAIKEDITAQKKMTEELIAARDKAEEMNRIKSYFYANMSHELRTPFVGILGYSELLTESLLDEDQKYMANQILSSSRRLTETLNKVLDITKLEFDKIEPVAANTDIFEMIKNLQSLFLVSAEAKKTVIKTEFGCEPFMHKTDERLLREVLTNLINNAVKFTAGGVITISVEKISKENKDHILIKVADTGVGIPKDKQELIWQEFRQVSEGLNRSFEGTGLGLTIVKKYTELLGGQIFVESEVGKGSVFTIELPVNNDDAAIEKQAVKVNGGSKIISSVGKEFRPKILYVEDDPVAVQFVSYLLQKDYELTTESDAKKVLQLVNKTTFDLLLIDINLGHGMDGVELTQLIRQLPSYKEIPIIAVTAYASNNDKEEFLSKGFSHYLSKPFTINDLKEILTQALVSVT